MKVAPGFSQVFPYLFVEDAAGYVRFLQAAFGAEEVGRHEHEGRVANAQVRIGEASFMLSEAQPPKYPACRSAHYLFVADADQALEKALAAGAILDFEVRDMPYGDRQCGVRDLGGNLWFLSERLEDGPYYP
ncbi:MAG: VOC family protein [Planctomycetota bacterium]